ncbi:helix-turn-helix domain-containing protein [Selenomonas artemidis]|jgi:predicted transcriptional regulators|uniref:helix-turn-helix domain-containing protein n=1 Tax=Selenomonas artemidis TaxID=671224 RepID=UPI00288A64EC|nr:helix-turn-helix transcriptional regulator [Selenomonas artemidis]
MQNLNEILSERRKELGLTLDEVATFVGVNKATVSRWESGGIDNMRLDKIPKLAKILKLSPALIMGMHWEPGPIHRDPIPYQLEQILKEKLIYKGVVLNEDDKEKIKRALELIFWDDKEQNKGEKKA